MRDSLGERGDAGAGGGLLITQISHLHPLFLPPGCLRRLSNMRIHSWPTPQMSSSSGSREEVADFLVTTPFLTFGEAVMAVVGDAEIEGEGMLINSLAHLHCQVLATY